MAITGCKPATSLVFCGTIIWCTQCCMRAFLAIAGPRVREELDKSWQYAVCFWVCLKEWALFSAPCLQAQSSMVHARHVPPTPQVQQDSPFASVQKEGSGTGTRYAPYNNLATGGRRLGRRGWSGRSPSHQPHILSK